MQIAANFDPFHTALLLYRIILGINSPLILAHAFNDHANIVWFFCTCKNLIADNKGSQKVAYVQDTDEEGDSDALSEDDEESFFFSDEEDNMSCFTEHKEKTGEFGGMNKTAQLGVGTLKIVKNYCKCSTVQTFAGRSEVCK